jgi:hypothetical protein
MTDRFNYTASKLSDQELKERIENRPKYLPETVEASLTELKSRGVEFTDEELRIIDEDLAAQRENALSPKTTGAFSKDYKVNIVDDEAAPYFYSKRAIYVFSFFCGALFGSILLAINLSKIKRYKQIAWVLLFGGGFTAITLFIGSYYNAGSTFGVFCGIISANVMDYLFWNRFIGNEIFYRARPIWVPLIIAISFLALVFAAIVLNPQQV